MSITVKVYLVDGSYSESPAQASILEEHDELVRQGYGGKQLIHRLISDDWGPPPRSVVLDGVAEDGQRVEIAIHYD
ncbi:MAG: hypothetical protein HYX47_01910 [Burkholderiales bacterium]|nr:hypothetical protein [Burkholderiales bacterium]